MEQLQEEDLVRIRTLLQHTSEFMAYFEIAESKMREWRQSIEHQATRLQQQQELLQALTEKSLVKIDKHGEQVTQQMMNQLSQYDPQQFQQIVTDSYEQVKRAANDAVSKSNKLLHTFQIRFNFFAVMITILTAFIVVLYLNGELPWEMHHQAKNERAAGKVLLQAWPKLSQAEREKILGYIHNT